MVDYYQKEPKVQSMKTQTDIVAGCLVLDARIQLYTRMIIGKICHKKGLVFVQPFFYF